MEIAILKQAPHIDQCEFSPPVSISPLSSVSSTQNTNTNNDDNAAAVSNSRRPLFSHAFTISIGSLIIPLIDQKMSQQQEQQQQQQQPPQPAAAPPPPPPPPPPPAPHLGPVALALPALPPLALPPPALPNLALPLPPPVLTGECPCCEACGYVCDFHQWRCSRVWRGVRYEV